MAIPSLVRLLYIVLLFFVTMHIHLLLLDLEMHALTVLVPAPVPYAVTHVLVYEHMQLFASVFAELTVDFRYVASRAGFDVSVCRLTCISDSPTAGQGYCFLYLWLDIILHRQFRKIKIIADL